MAEPNSRRRATLRIEGRVQGVFFRESARREAERLGVRGWVRNAADGTVEAEIEAASEAFEAFVAWCRRGPPTARVTAVKIEESVPQGELTAFTVER